MEYIGSKTITESTFFYILRLKELLDQNPNFLEKLNEKKYTTKDTDKTFRTINFWESEGLLDNTREKGNEKWRKFSLIDIVYMQILSKLRDFGFSIQKLKKVKIDLMKELDYEGVKTSFSVLEYAYIRTINSNNRGNVYLVATPEGNIYCTTISDMLFAESIYGLPDSYIFINLNKLLTEKINFNSGDKIPVHDEHLYVLDGKGEEELLELLRTSEFNNINIISKKDGGLLIEKVFDAAEKDSFPEFADITIKLQDGKVVSKKVKEKIKID